jgi:hypothetical protein
MRGVGMSFAGARNETYDAKQMAAEWTICGRCRRAWFMTRVMPLCVLCRRAAAKKASA